MRLVQEKDQQQALQIEEQLCGALHTQGNPSQKMKLQPFLHVDATAKETSQ